MKNVDYALKYRARGWSVIPIKPGTKLPIPKSWLAFQSKPATENEIRAWWRGTPEAGIALVCGKVSGVIIVDIDKKNGGDQTARKLELPPTLATRTGGGGNHYMYKWRAGLVGAKVGIAEGVDIRSDNSYAILPPSLHASGNLYEWIDEDEQLAPAPAWLEEGKQEKEKTDWEQFFSDKKGKGLRNMSAAQLAGKILYDTSPEMWDTLGVSYFKQWNKEFNNPSLPEKELMTTWNSIKKTHLKNNPAPEPEAGEGELDAPTNPGAQDEKAVVKLFTKNKAKGTFLLARYLTQKYSIITVGEKEREMFVYRDGTYFRAENEIIFPEIQRILGDIVTKSAKMEAFHKIADMTAKSRAIFTQTPPNFIPLKNGVYDLNTKKLLPHAPEYRFKYQFPVLYNETAHCPKTLAFFDQILTEEQRPTIQEWLGYYFYRFYAFKKAIIFVGEGDTGKTTLLETIVHMLGRDNLSSVSLQKMTSDKFAAAHLYEKHGNLVDELSAKDISDTGNFKIATGGGSISGEYKFGNQFSFQNFSKFTFACNKIPDVKDFEDEAYFNRWMVIRFENPITKKIPNFIESLKTEEERAGLFNFAMEGLRRLLEQGHFTYGKTAVETKVEMMRSGSSIATFVAERCSQDVGAEITKEDMYEAYTAHCATGGLAAETIKMFGSKFLFYVSYATEGLIDDVKGHRAVRSRGWRNVKVLAHNEPAKQDRAQVDTQDGGAQIEIIPPVQDSVQAKIAEELGNW